MKRMQITSAVRPAPRLGSTVTAMKVLAVVAILASACSPAPQAAPTAAPKPTTAAAPAATTAPAPTTAPAAAPTAAPAAKPTTGPAATSAPAPAATTAPVAYSGPPRKLEIAQTTIGAIQWPIYVASDLGFFKDAGIDPNITVMDTNLKEVQALLSGSVGIAGGSPDVLIKAVAKDNSDLVVVGAVTDHPVYTLVAQKDVKSYADLKGKRVGVSAELSMDGLWMKQLLQSNGLQPSDVEIVEIGGTAARMAALQSNGVAATLLTQPQDFQALRQGYIRLGASTDIVKEIVWSGYNTTRSWADKNKQLLIDFLRVVRRSHEWLYNPANKDQAIQILEKNANTPQQDATDTYNLWITQGGLTKEGETTPQAVQTMIDSLVSTQQMPSAVPVDKVFDPSWMQQAAAAR